MLHVTTGTFWWRKRSRIRLNSEEVEMCLTATSEAGRLLGILIVGRDGTEIQLLKSLGDSEGLMRKALQACKTNGVRVRSKKVENSEWDGGPGFIAL